MLLIFKITIAIACAFSLLLFRQITTKFYKVVLVLQVVGAVLSFFEHTVIKMSGIALFYIMVLVVVVYGLMFKKYARSKKILIGLLCIPAFLQALFMVQHWPGVSYLMLFQVVSLVAFLIILRKRKNYQDELGSLTIIAATALTNIMWWFIALFES